VTLFPSSWTPHFSELLPKDPNSYHGPSVPYGFVFVALCILTVRSLIHLLKDDGGAQSIATIDIAGAGGNNIVGLFGQWGGIQLLLACLLWTLVFRYQGLLSLVLLVLLIEPHLRALSGKIKPIVTLEVAPGAAYNWRVVPILGLMFYMSLCAG
jgi:hypothetical protein